MNTQESGFLDKNKICGGRVSTVVHKQPSGCFTFGCGKVCQECGRYYTDEIHITCFGRKLITLKRYKNRKMRGNVGHGYQDFTLSEIHDLISEGYDVKILCYVTKKDMTREILLRVLEEKESWIKKKSENLNDIIKIGGFSAYINTMEI